MTHKNYQQGRDFEYQVMAALKERFPEPKHQVIRTAGSHSPVDILIFKVMNREYATIQCKSLKKGDTFEDTSKKLIKKTFIVAEEGDGDI